jgi:hypothetical protein
VIPRLGQLPEQDILQLHHYTRTIEGSGASDIPSGLPAMILHGIRLVTLYTESVSNSV